MLIKDICTSITDGSHNPPQGIASSSYLMLSSKNVFDDKITLDEPRFLSEEDFAKENKRTNVKCGDILLTIVGTVGRAAVVSSDLPPFTLQRSVAVLHPKEEVCSSRYLMYALRGKRSYIESHSKGVAQKGIYLKEVAGIDLPVHPKAMQEKITNRLDKLAFIIKCRQQELQKLDDLVRARFVELFGDMFLNTMSWNEEPLEEMANVVSGITKGRKLKAQCTTEVPYMAVSNVKDGYIDWTTVKTIEATEQEINQYRLLPEDVLMTEGGDPDKLGRGAIIKEPLENCIHQNHIFRVRLNATVILPEFFAEYLRHQKSKRYFLGCAKQTTGIASINMRQLKALPVLLPPLELQNQFADFVKVVDKSKAAVQKALDQAQLLFDSLMQEYFG